MLPRFTPHGKYRGRPIRSLPGLYLPADALTRQWHPALRAALRAEDGFRTMAGDQRTGRL